MSRDLPKLIGGPYPQPPARDCRVGATVGDLIFGDVTIAALAELPIGPWPVHVRRNGYRMPLISAALAKAIRTESRLAVAAWWGVSTATAWTWRHALGCGRWTPGTLALWRELAPHRLDHDARVKGARVPKPYPVVKLPDRQTAKLIAELGRLWGGDRPLSDGRVVVEAIRRVYEADVLAAEASGEVH